MTIAMHTIGRHLFAAAFAASVGVTCYLLATAGYGWFVLEQRAMYGVMGPMPTWSEPTMIVPAALTGLLMWRLAAMPATTTSRRRAGRPDDAVCDA